MIDRSITDTFHIFRVFKVARIFMGHDTYEVSILDPTLCDLSVPGLVPEIKVSSRFL